MADLMVYEKRTCTTCKNLAVLLEDRGVDFDRVPHPVARAQVDADEDRGPARVGHVRAGHAPAAAGVDLAVGQALRVGQDGAVPGAARAAAPAAAAAALPAYPDYSAVNRAPNGLATPIRYGTTGHFDRGYGHDLGRDRHYWDRYDTGLSTRPFDSRNDRFDTRWNDDFVRLQAHGIA